MGLAVLYIAFGIVALWLLAEVLLQYKARLRWRILAFTGFMGVVLGVLIGSVPVIVLGTIAFAAGQTYVTLSYRSGFSMGWAIGGRPGASRRRKAGAEPAADREPALEVSDLEYEPVDRPAGPAAVYATEPLPDDTGQYGVYDDAVQDAHTAGRAAAHPHGSQETADSGGYGGGYDAYPGYGTPQGGQDAYAAHDPYAPQDAYASQDLYAGQGGYAAQDGYATNQGGYGYGSGDQQYAAYADPYNGGAADGGRQYEAYDSFGGRQQYTAPYGDHTDQQGYGNDTPPGGVWVPQQRERQDDPFPPAPGEKPQQGYDAGSGYNDQYRY
ncbi:hypothetical protein [Streptomyces sp. NPDC059134]|uniref:hypothetical protein n=1 Tax=Streptomyces sp. NPDC059134 TaxID=3346738 RepID=UPI0036C21B80